MTGKVTRRQFRASDLLAMCQAIAAIRYLRNGVLKVCMASLPVVPHMDPCS